jgi:hypothetical protein
MIPGLVHMRCSKPQLGWENVALLPAFHLNSRHSRVQLQAWSGQSQGHCGSGTEHTDKKIQLALHLANMCLLANVVPRWTVLSNDLRDHQVMTVE